MKRLAIMLSLILGFILNSTNNCKAQCNINDWKALKALYETTDGDNWTNRNGWKNIIDNRQSPPPNCNLNNLFGVIADPVNGRVTHLNLSGTLDYAYAVPLPLTTQQVQIDNNNLTGNNLNGFIPQELTMLNYLETLVIVNDNLRNNDYGYVLPYDIYEIETLTKVVLYGNQLSGVIPNLPAATNVQLQQNYFTCEELINFADQNQIDSFYYSSQYFAHDFSSFIVDTNSTANIVIDFSNYILGTTSSPPPNNNSSPIPKSQTSLPITITNNTSFEWRKNGLAITVGSGNQNQGLELVITNPEPKSAGAYNLHIFDDCMPNIEFISDPVYVIYPGYDLHGQPVEYDQIMVEFENVQITEKSENDILYPNGGWVADACNCNREIYLWQFPTTETAASALVEIDKKTKTTNSSGGEIDGGFVNSFLFDEAPSLNTGFDIIYNTTNSMDEVVVYMLDTGLDSNNFENSSFLNPNAPLDACYQIPNGPGYSYVDNVTISNDYNDEVWHGTFGFDVITRDFPLGSNIKLIPLKIFDSAGQGNLFDLTCALYHAIDHGANIVNISAGYKGEKSTILERAVNKARESNIFICAATGNDSENIDANPQYPASFASLYHYIYDKTTKELIDSVRYANVISVGCLDAQNNVSAFSNNGENSVTLYANGEDINGLGLNNEQISASGTSMATFLVTRELALEIAADNTRNYEVLFQDFQTNRLVTYPNINSISNARLNITLESSSNRLSNTFTDVKVKHFNEENVVYADEQKILLNYKSKEDGFLYAQLYDMNGKILNTQQKFVIPAGKKLLEILINNSTSNNIYLLKTKFVAANGKYSTENVKILLSQ